MPKVDPGIFKAYDVRGLYPEQLDERLAYRVGRAFARVLAGFKNGASGNGSAAGLRVAVGHDMRLHSPALAREFCSGLTDEGCDVLFIGMVGTEMVYYAIGSRGFDGGASVTASHNPKAWAGFKLLREGALALSGEEGIQDVRRLVEENDFAEPTAKGKLEEANIYEEFQHFALDFIEAEVIRPMEIVLDGGNGMAGPMIGPIIDSFPVAEDRLYFEPNGEFPDHEPNPLLEENRRLIMDTVLDKQAELGIAWDGDADRCFFIDDGGEFVPGDFLTALLAEAILAKEPGAAIIYDVRASRAVPDTITRCGGRPVMNRVGHAFFKKRMREEGAAFGGEVSGHYYFRNFWCADSGVIPALLVLELLSVKEQTMAELLAPFRKRYFISGEINSEVEDKEAKMKELAEIHSDAEITWLDGVSVDYEDWHFNVRPSNTEPLLRLNLEAFTQEEMEARTEEVLGDNPRVTAGGRLSSDEALERAAAEGIHTLRIPTPFAVGRVNTYLIEDEPLTLVDSGPNSGKSLDDLEHQLAERGHSIDDIELIVLTHQHIDHIGLVEIIVGHSGADVAAIDKMVHFIEHYGEDAGKDDEFASGIMLRNGIPEEVVQALRSVSAAFRSWGGSAKVTRPLRDGARLELRARTLEVMHRPGHSPSDTVFWDAERRILFAADHLIKHISSNPLIARPLEDGNGLDAGPERPKALVTYIESLRKTRELPAEIVLPGHGEPITDHVALIDERLEFHRRRAEKIYDLIAEQPRSGYELAQALFGNVAVTQAYLTLSEVLGHVDLLLEDSRVSEHERDGVVYFEASR